MTVLWLCMRGSTRSLWDWGDGVLPKTISLPTILGSGGADSSGLADPWGGGGGEGGGLKVGGGGSGTHKHLGIWPCVFRHFAPPLAPIKGRVSSAWVFPATLGPLRGWAPEAVMGLELHEGRAYDLLHLLQTRTTFWGRT